MSSLLEFNLVIAAANQYPRLEKKLVNCIQPKTTERNKSGGK